MACRSSHVSDRDPTDAPATHVVAGPFYRCVGRRHDPLSAEGARLNGGRYNRVGDPTVYLADDPMLAVQEHLHRGSAFDVPRFNPRLLVTIEVSLANVLDLTDARTRGLLGVTLDDLVGRGSEASLEQTRAIGDQARAEGLEGVLAPSAWDPCHANLAVFPENRRTASVLSVIETDDCFDSRKPTD